MTRFIETIQGEYVRADRIGSWVPLWWDQEARQTTVRRPDKGHRSGWALEDDMGGRLGSTYEDPPRDVVAAAPGFYAVEVYFDEEAGAWTSTQSPIVAWAGACYGSDGGGDALPVTSGEIKAHGVLAPDGFVYPVPGDYFGRFTLDGFVILVSEDREAVQAARAVQAILR